MIKSLISSEQIADEALDRFWETVPPLWGNIRAHIRALATEEFSISIEQFQILRLIRSGRGSVSELASAKNISRPAISQAVDVLVRKGLLTRTPDAEDRRHIQLALTPSGNALLDALFRKTRSWMRSKLSSFSRDELENVIRAMESLKKMLKDYLVFGAKWTPNLRWVIDTPSSTFGAYEPYSETPPFCQALLETRHPRADLADLAGLLRSLDPSPDPAHHRPGHPAA